ncbi:DUF4168 domain-containing protein [Hyphomonadaceae bacterium ML37]|nr:DUF4168 domain-containing protein [Hyphomonadaceae bacterium ML37]
MTMMFKTTASALALALGAAYAAPAALAQQAPPPPQQGMPAQQQPQIEPVTDEEIWNFVRAVDQVSGIVEELRPQLEAANGQEEAQLIQQDAQAQMIEAVEDEGLTPERYNEINMAAQSDPELGERISEIAEEYREQNG